MHQAYRAMVAADMPHKDCRSFGRTKVYRISPQVPIEDFPEHQEYESERSAQSPPRFYFAIIWELLSAAGLAKNQ